MTDAREKEARLETIRRIVARDRISSQEDLVEVLRKRRYPVTQSSVCRDLRDLQITKVQGIYRLPPREALRNGLGLAETIASLVQSLTPAGPHVLVAHTEVGAASRVGLALDQTQWTEIVGTVAGDDTIFIATPGRREQKRLQQRLEPYLEGKGA